MNKTEIIQLVVAFLNGRLGDSDQFYYSCKSLECGVNEKGDQTITITYNACRNYSKDAKEEK